MEVIIPLVNSGAPWSLIPVELFPRVPTDIVSEIAARAQTN